MTIPLGTEMNQLFLSVSACLYHSLLSGTVRSNDTVTLHFRFFCHYFFLAAFFITAFTTFFATAFFATGAAAIGAFNIEDAGRDGFAFFISLGF
jgi:hypothetical protein